MKHILYLYFLFNFNLCFSSSMYSLLNQNAVYFSFSHHFDSIDVLNQNSQSSTETATLNKYKIGYVYNGKYDFYFEYVDNKSSLSNFHYNEKDIYWSYCFKYNFNNFEKLPFNIQFGTKYTESSHSMYETKIIMLNIYKEFNSGNYPVIPYLSLSKIDYNNENDGLLNHDNMLTLGSSIKLTVDIEDNSVLKDVIFLSPSINTYDYSQFFFGFTFGLFHPI